MATRGSTSGPPAVQREGSHAIAHHRPSSQRPAGRAGPHRLGPRPHQRPGVRRRPDPGPARTPPTWLIGQLTDGLDPQRRVRASTTSACRPTSAFGLERSAATTPRSRDRRRDRAARRGRVVHLDVRRRDHDVRRVAGQGAGARPDRGVDRHRLRWRRTSSTSLEAPSSPTRRRSPGRIAGREQRLRRLPTSSASPSPSRRSTPPAPAEADAATNFLLKQQCGAGLLPARASPRPRTRPPALRDGAADSAPDTDATALAMINLLATAAPTPDVADAVAAAEEWLARASSGPTAPSAAARPPRRPTPTAPASPPGRSAATRTTPRLPSGPRAGCAATRPSTSAPARRGPRPTPARSPTTDAARMAGQAHGDHAGHARPVAPCDRPGPARCWTGPPPAPATDATAHRRVRQAGTDAAVGVTGAAPGDALCADAWATQRVLGAADADGEAHRSWSRSRAGDRHHGPCPSSDGATSRHRRSIDVLGAMKLRSPSRPRSRTGKQQVVKVSGLAPGEAVRVVLPRPQGRRPAWPTAKGSFNARFTVTGKTGQGEGRGRSGSSRTATASKTFMVDRLTMRPSAVAASSPRPPWPRRRASSCPPAPASAAACSSAARRHRGRGLPRARRRRAAGLRRRRRRQTAPPSCSAAAASRSTYVQRQPGFVCRVSGEPAERPLRQHARRPTPTGACGGPTASPAHWIYAPRRRERAERPGRRLRRVLLERQRRPVAAGRQPVAARARAHGRPRPGAHRRAGNGGGGDGNGGRRQRVGGTGRRRADVVAERRTVRLGLGRAREGRQVATSPARRPDRQGRQARHQGATTRPTRTSRHRRTPPSRELRVDRGRADRGHAVRRR